MGAVKAIMAIVGVAAILMGGVLANVVVIPLMGLYGVWRSRGARRRRARLQALQAELAGNSP